MLEGALSPPWHLFFGLNTLSCFSFQRDRTLVPRRLSLRSRGCLRRQWAGLGVLWSQVAQYAVA